MRQSSNIVFINPPNAPFTSAGILIEPIDLLGLTSWTASLGHDVSLLDMDVKCLVASDLTNIFNNAWPKVLVIVFDYHIPLHDVGANNQIKAICETAREHGCTTILGGKIATFWNEEKLQNINADMYVAYEMEYVLRDLFEVLSNGQSLTHDNIQHIKGVRYMHNAILHDNGVYPNKVDLTSLPISDRNLIDLDDYIDVRTLLSSRGCNLKCTFCHVPGFWGLWRGRSAVSVADEIECLVQQHGAKKILFLDDNAIVQPKRMQDIATEIQNRHIKVALGCLGTIHKYDANALEKMYDGGFRWIHYGAESGDDNQLAQMGKKITSEKIMQAVKGTQNAGLRVRTSWIMDMPNLTADSLLKTEDMILGIGSEEIRLHFLTLRLGSILHSERLHLDTPQFIHNGKQNLNISGVDDKMIEDSVQRILDGLVKQGYTVVRNADEFKNVAALKIRSPGLKIVSLCPLRYGLGWHNE